VTKRTKPTTKAKPIAAKASTKAGNKAKPKAKPIPSKAKPAPKPKGKAVAPSKAKSKPAAKKPAPVAKKAAPAKKVAPAKKAPPAKKVTPVKKAPSAKKTAPVKKAPPAKKVAPAKVAASAKKVVAAKAPLPKSAPAKVAKAAAPAAKPAKPTVENAPKGGKAKVEPVKIEVIAEPEVARAPLNDPKAEPIRDAVKVYDSHMHTPLCKHAWGEPEEYAQQGIKSGMNGIIFTCHCPMPDGFWQTVRMAESEFDTYVAMVERTRNAYKGKIDVLLGMESEYYPGCEEWIEKLHQRADFHFIIGSVHWQAKEYLAKYETGTIEGFRRTYFDHLAKSAETGLYDCLGHPDLVKNYNPDSWCFPIIKGPVASALDRIAATGVAMELNTSGLNKSYSEMNPGMEMLKMMADRNIPIVVGSDAHRAHRVGEHFVTAYNHLLEAGYEYVSYFIQRRRHEIRISDALASMKRATDAQS
jgi:HisJ family histidinol phosphate phosphatase